MCWPNVFTTSVLLLSAFVQKAMLDLLCWCISGVSIHCQYPYVCSRWSSWLYLTCNCQYWLSFLSVHSLDGTARCLNREWYILMFKWIKSILLFIYLFFQVFYFRTYLDIVILGILHRLLLLPVTLSYVGPIPRKVPPTTTSLDHTSAVSERTPLIKA